MSDKINLKALERKAYLIYHEDGLLDIGIGAVLAWIARARKRCLMSSEIQ